MNPVSRLRFNKGPEMSKHNRTTTTLQKSVSTPTKSNTQQLEDLLPKIQATHEAVERRLAYALETAREAGELPKPRS